MTQESQSALPKDLASSTRTVRRAGVGVLSLLVIVACVWGTFVELPQAVISTGTVTTQAPTHMIQHPDGGAIAAVHVAEGDGVAKDAILISLDDRAWHEEREKLLHDAAAAMLERARIIADLENRRALSLDPATKALIEDLGLSQTRDLEAARLTAHVLERTQHQRRLAARIDGLGHEIEHYEKRLGFQREKIERTETQVTSHRRLRERSRIKASDLEEIERRYLEHQDEVAATEASLARTRLERRDAELEMQTFGTEDKVKNMARLAELDRMIPGLRLKIRELERRIARSSIRAPVDGIALNLRYRALGAVVAPHDPILDIVPNGEEFTLELSVRPVDIDRVAPGMRAQVMLSAFPQRLMPRIEAVVTRVAGDAVTAEDGSAHYKVWLKLDEASLAAADESVPFDIHLKPGMPVEAYVLTESNTLLGHLIEPFVRTFDHAFRDG